MLKILCAVILVLVFRKWFLFGVKAAWGTLKMCVLAAAALVLIGVIIKGLIAIALPVLLLLGLLSVFVPRRYE